MIDTAPIRAFLDDKHVALAEEVTRFATRLLEPLAEPADDAAARHQARDLLGMLGAAGWFEPIRDQDWRACCLIREALGATSPLADAVFALQALGVVPMLLSSNDAMRERWLEPAVRGKAMASFAMTEPDAGSDVASLGTKAERDGDAYVLAVLPAAAALDLAGFKRRVGRYGLTVAKDEQFRAELPELGDGPVPPFGRMVAIPVYLDRALAGEAVMRFEGDADRETVSLPMRDYVRVERPAIAPLTQALRAA